MPLYAYHCPSCGTDYEALVPVDGSAPCPTCGSCEVRKLVSAAEFVLRGPGWARDGYGIKAPRRDEGASD